MRFKKGSKVEVPSKKDVPPGFWRCAEIISSNGHNYMIRYDGYGGTGVERISKKAIRPCPPEVVANWVLGDVVEVFNEFSWKMATISKVLGDGYFMVRLLGSSLEIKVSKFDIRARQSWQDEKWIMIGKGSTSCEGGDKIPESNTASSPSLKRRPYCCSQIKASGRETPKLRAFEKKRRVHQVIVAAKSHEEAGGLALPRETMGKNFLQFSSNKQSQFSEMDAEWRQPIGATGRSFVNDTDSVTCSVGSCSITSKNSLKLRHHAGFVGDTDAYHSDAESYCKWEDEEENSSLQMKEDLATEIHRLELQAYHCTIEALHASGPLSWEQEALMTNLRLSLHISNDEHLMEGQNRRLSHLFEISKGFL